MSKTVQRIKFESIANLVRQNSLLLVVLLVLIHHHGTLAVLAQDRRGAFALRRVLRSEKRRAHGALVLVHGPVGVIGIGKLKENDNLTM